MINISTLNSQTQRSIERERGMEESFVATIFQVLQQQYFVHKLFLFWGNIVHFIHRSYQKALRYLGEEDRHRSWTINYIYDDGQRFHKACTVYNVHPRAWEANLGADPNISKFWGAGK